MGLSLDEISDIRVLAKELALEIPWSEDLSPLSRPVAVGPLTAPNALAIHPMEGCDGDAEGRPGPLTLRRYERFASGGAGLLWAEAIAVVPEGRANARQLWLHAKSAPAFAAMVAMMRRVAAERFGAGHRPILVAQLTHSGRYSRPLGKPNPLIPQRDPHRDGKMNLPGDWPVLTDDELDRLPEQYARAARLAFEAGFDAVDVKACHGYLVNELFACHQRPGKYGGSFENRTRFYLDVVDRLRSELPAGKLITTRLGVFDAIPHPFGWGVDREDAAHPDLSEPMRLIRELAARGMPMVNITIANPYYNPHYGRPYNEPTAGGYPSPEHPLVGVARMVRIAGEIQASFPQIAVVGTGYSWLRTAFPQVAAGAKQRGLAAFVGGGRMAFAYPDFARDILERGALDADKVCVGCSACTQIMRDGGRAGCVVRDEAVYGPIFRRGRMSNRENLARLAKPCRTCRDAMCRRGCPAGVRVPQFIKAFLDGKDREAYETIRENNIFPELCAALCPVEQQCQGHCLNRHIGDGPMPIAAIQRYLAEQANAQGWSRLRMPEASSGKRVAVIGAGPAGLACAAKLLEQGHGVALFDDGGELGGVVESVIPSVREGNVLRSEMEAIFKDAPADRFRVFHDRPLSAGFTLDEVLREGYDAVFLGMGLPKSSTSLAGCRASGLWGAMEFLRAVKRGDAVPRLEGHTAVVIGGGNTAMDAAVAAKDLGAQDVYLLYRRSFAEMPAWPSERDRALAAGVHVLILTQPVECLEQGGRVSGIRVCRTRLGAPDASGRRAPHPVAESAYTLPADVIIEAVGQQAADDLALLLPGVELANGLIRLLRGSRRTTRAAVYAGGDCTRGPATVVEAVADGMIAAEEIDRALRCA